MSRRRTTSGPATTPAEVFGELLRDIRSAAGLTQDELALKIPCDRSQVARVEGATRVPARPFAVACDEVLHTNGVLARMFDRINWNSDVEHPDWFKRRAAMDGKATALYEFQTQVMPGLLQTEDYARALFARVAAGDEAKLVESRVAARLSRQRRFLDPDGPLLVVVLDESAIHNVVGDVPTMRDQCAHLLAVGTQPNIRLQVAPSTRINLIRPNTSMSLITLPDGEQWVYSESLDRGHMSKDPTTIARHKRTYDVLRADALSAHDSAALISDAMEGFSQHDAGRSDSGYVAQEQLQRRQRRQLHRSGPRFPQLRSRP